MTLVLDLPAEVEAKLREAAARRGVPLEDYAIERLRAPEPTGHELKLKALDDILKLGAHLTAGTSPLHDDAVARSYEAST